MVPGEMLADSPDQIWTRDPFPPSVAGAWDFELVDVEIGQTHLCYREASSCHLVSIVALSVIRSVRNRQTPPPPTHTHTKLKAYSNRGSKIAISSKKKTANYNLEMPFPFSVFLLH